MLFIFDQSDILPTHPECQLFTRQALFHDVQNFNVLTFSVLNEQLIVPLKNH